MALGDQLTLSIERMGQAGDGVGRIQDGRLAFVSGALPGELVNVRVTEERRNFVRAHVISREVHSPERVEPVCPIVAECGGCALQHWDYRAELRYKENRVREALRRAGLATEVLGSIRAGSDPYGYRNKGQFPVGGRPGQVEVGLYRRGSHEVVEASHCDIQDPWVNQVLAVVGPALSESGLPPWDEASKTGVLRHVLIRSSHKEQRVLVLLVTTVFDPSLKGIAESLMHRLPIVAGVGVNVNPDAGNRVLGREALLLAGVPTITDELLGLQFRMSFTSFFQVNPRQAAVLYEAALSFLPKHLVEIWDLYSGVGTLAALAASRARTVRALESLPQAVLDARENFAINGLKNIAIEAGRVEHTIDRWIHDGRRAPDAVIVDPPRAGLDSRVVDAIAALGPRQIIYVSCNPDTWVRDLVRLGEKYRLQAAVPVDMFPRTDHVEVASSLVRCGQGL